MLIVNPLIWTLPYRNQTFEVRCHFSEDDDYESVRDQTARKALIAVANMDHILTKVLRDCCQAGIENVAQLAPHTLAMMSGCEPVLYIFVPLRNQRLEVHVNLTEEMEFEFAELIEP